MTDYTYKIDEKTYVQRTLVLAQVRQLLDLLQGMQIPGNLDALGLVSLLGDRLPLLLAVVLTEKGKSAKNKDLPALADELEYAISPEQTITVIEDFFGCNPLSSILTRLAGMAEKITAQIGTGSPSSPASSAPETSPDATGSSGA